MGEVGVSGCVANHKPLKHRQNSQRSNNAMQPTPPHDVVAVVGGRVQAGVAVDLWRWAAGRGCFLCREPLE